MKQVHLLLLILSLHNVRSENDFFDQVAQHFADLAGSDELSFPALASQQTKLDSHNDSILGFPEIETTSGSMVGASYPESHSFFSVPYAQAPIGNLRFQAPESIEEKQARNVSVPDFVRCYQFDRDCQDESECDANFSEDCLVVNIFVPSTVGLSSPPSERLPVMFWLHGGAFFFGGGTISYYNSRWLCNETNTIVVTVNYRLGPLGFLVYDENGQSFGGNQGIKDQQLALKWVYENIENFGGDKDMITMFGQSAGAQSVNFHLISEVSKPYFKRAIMQSNPAGYYYPTKLEAKIKTEALLKAINCEGSGMECLMSIPALDLVNAHLRVAFSRPLTFLDVVEPYRPVLDQEFPNQPRDSFRFGNWQHEKEVIIGVTSEEVAYISVFLKNFTVRKALFEAFTAFVVGDEYADDVINKYYEVAGNVGPLYDYTDILAQEIADMLFVCPSKALGRIMASTSSVDSTFPAVYFYVHDYRMEASNCKELSKFCGYAYHAGELPFVFSNGPNQGYMFTENDYAIEKLYNNFWGYFAYHGRPSGDVKTWPHYASESQVGDGIDPWSNFRFAAPNGLIESDYSKELCEFWDNLGIYNNTYPTTTAPTQNPEETDPAETASTVSAVMTTSGAGNSALRVDLLMMSVLTFFCLVDELLIFDRKNIIPQKEQNLRFLKVYFYQSQTLQ